MFVTGKHRRSNVLLELLFLRNSVGSSTFRLHYGLRMCGGCEVVHDTFAVERTYRYLKNLRQAM
jgi:hypothetical protein